MTDMNKWTEAALSARRTGLLMTQLPMTPAAAGLYFWRLAVAPVALAVLPKAPKTAGVAMQAVAKAKTAKPKPKAQAKGAVRKAATKAKPPAPTQTPAKLETRSYQVKSSNQKARVTMAAMPERLSEDKG